MPTVVDRIYFEDAVVIPPMSPIDPFELWRGMEPTRIQIGDEIMTVIDSGPGWADVQRGTQ